MKSVLFLIVIVAGALLLLGFIAVHGSNGGAAHKPGPGSSHSIVCQPGPRPEC